MNVVLKAISSSFIPATACARGTFESASQFVMNRRILENSRQTKPNALTLLSSAMENALKELWFVLFIDIICKQNH